MRTVTKKHLSTHNGKSLFAQVTVAALTPEEEKARPRGPELYLNDFRVNRLSREDEVLVQGVLSAVREAEKNLGWNGVPLCVTRIESSYVGRDPEAARIAATLAAASLIDDA